MKPPYPKRFTVDEVGIVTHTGLRASEACALLWADINLDKGFLVVRCGKGGKMRRVVLTSSLIQLSERTPGWDAL